MPVGKMVFESLSRGWYLTKLSFSIINQEKKLLLLPIISGLCLIAVVLSFIIPLIGVFLWWPKLLADNTAFSIFYYVMYFVFYLVTYFVGVFFNSALIHMATVKLQGGHPTIGEGLRKAGENIGLIFKWALLAATVGLILKAIQQKAGFIGRIVIGFIGAAWSIAIYFVVPIIIYEKQSGFGAVKRSLQIMRNTWGEALGGGLGMGIIFFLLALIGVVLLFVGIYAAIAMNSLWIFVGFLLGTIFYWLFLAILASAAHGVLVAALYRYAVTGQLSPGFQQSIYTNPWAGQQGAQAPNYNAPRPY
jgi:hypothetical protein